MPETEDDVKSEVYQVSVVMSVYNNESMLCACLDSIFLQDGVNYEVIVVDDGSTDGTPQILEAYAKSHENLSIYHEDHVGLSRALNIGISHAQAEYIARMDPDDEMLQGRLKIQADFLDHNIPYAAVGSCVEMFDEYDAPLGPAHKPINHETILGHLLTARNPMIHSTVMLRKHVWDVAGGYDEMLEVAQDFDLWLRLTECGRLANMPQRLVRYRCHLVSVTGEKSVLQGESMLYSLQRYYAIKRLPVPETVNEYVTNFVMSGRSQSEQEREWALNALRNGYIEAARCHASASMKRGGGARSTIIYWLSMLPWGLGRVLMKLIRYSKY